MIFNRLYIGIMTVSLSSSLVFVKSVNAFNVFTSSLFDYRHIDKILELEKQSSYRNNLTNTHLIPDINRKEVFPPNNLLAERVCNPVFSDNGCVYQFYLEGTLNNRQGVVGDIVFPEELKALRSGRYQLSSLSQLTARHKSTFRIYFRAFQDYYTGRKVQPEVEYKDGRHFSNIIINYDRSFVEVSKNSLKVLVIYDAPNLHRWTVNVSYDSQGNGRVTMWELYNCRPTGSRYKVCAHGNFGRN